jgi:hypothetical protein
MFIHEVAVIKMYVLVASRGMDSWRMGSVCPVSWRIAVGVTAIYVDSVNWGISTIQSSVYAPSRRDNAT